MKNPIEPKILPGFMELLPKDQIVFNQIKNTIQNVYEAFGYLPLDTPVIEYANVLLAKAGGETEKQIYRFTKGENDLALRFDLTVPLARYVASHRNELIFPFKRYQIGKVFRGERPQHGRYREFYQCDIDVIGQETLSLAYDAEMPLIIYQIFQKLGFGKFTIHLNNRKILNGFFESLNLEGQITDILRIIDKLDKIGSNAVIEELQKIGIAQKQIETIIGFITTKGTNAEILTKLKDMAISNNLFNLGIEELTTVLNYLESANIVEEYYHIDLTIARGLDYYTGTVYETIIDDHRDLGSVCSGGRYENLTSYYSNETLPGVGISIGLTRLFAKLKEVNLLPNFKNNLTECLLIPLDAAQIPYATQTANALRDANISTDIYYQDKKIAQKIKFADRSGIPYVILIGEDEQNTGTLTIKDMLNSTQETVDIQKCIKIIKGE